MKIYILKKYIKENKTMYKTMYKSCLKYIEILIFPGIFFKKSFVWNLGILD
jgi:hypothetical protein